MQERGLNPFDTSQDQQLGEANFARFKELAATSLIPPNFALYSLSYGHRINNDPRQDPTLKYRDMGLWLLHMNFSTESDAMYAILYATAISRIKCLVPNSSEGEIVGAQIACGQIVKHENWTQNRPINRVRRFLRQPSLMQGLEQIRSRVESHFEDPQNATRFIIAGN